MKLGSSKIHIQAIVKTYSPSMLYYLGLLEDSNNLSKLLHQCSTECKEFHTVQTFDIVSWWVSNVPVLQTEALLQF